LVWSHTDQERVHEPVASLAGEALLVIDLLLDSEFLSFIDSTSTTRTSLSVCRLDDARIRMYFWALIRPQLEMTGLAVKTLPVASGGGGVKLFRAGVALKASLVKFSSTCREAFCIIDRLLASRTNLLLYNCRHLDYWHGE
jgi:hypothetical protein